MGEDSAAEILTCQTTQGEPIPAGTYTVLYDGQCEVCQACVSWLKTLDRRRQTVSLPISAETLSSLDPRLNLDACLRQLHILSPRSDMYVGWDAIATLARLFPSTWLIGELGRRFPFRNLGRALYDFVARNRYSLSKCRGGACRVAKPETVRRQARLGAFWSCYSMGFLIRSPLVMWAGVADAARRMKVFARTYRKRIDLLNGKLTILFLNGALPNTVPLIFGELFTAVLYDGVAIDPGSPKMRRSLARHLDQLKPRVSTIVATHAHEEHVGNLNWLSERTGAPVCVSEMTARFLTPFKKLPFLRAVVIGQPPNLQPPFQILGDTVGTGSGELQVIASPGHCDDHVVLYDPEEKVLLAGDAFMGTYFSTPNRCG